MEHRIEVFGIEKEYFSRSGKKRTRIKAVDEVSMTLKKGEALGIIGTSGCGKTTLLKLIMQLIKPDKGYIQTVGRLGFVAQDPYASLDPSMSIYKIIAEPLIFSGRKRNYKSCEQEVIKAMNQVHLLPEIYKNRFPAQLSGGERQRVSIARALILEPDFLLMDEPTSMLDQEVKQSIIELILEIAKSGRFGFLMVTHDIRTSAQICDRLIVMSNGKIVEQGSTDEIFRHPSHTVTKELIEVSTDVQKYWNLQLKCFAVRNVGAVEMIGKQTLENVAITGAFSA